MKKTYENTISFKINRNINSQFSQKMIGYNLYLELRNMLWVPIRHSKHKTLNLNKDHYFQVTIKPHVSVLK